MAQQAPFPHKVVLPRTSTDVLSIHEHAGAVKPCVVRNFVAGQTAFINPRTGSKSNSQEPDSFLIDAISRDKGVSHSMGGAPLCAQQHQQVGGPGPSEATLFTRAQGGCARSLDQLLRQHEGLVQAVVRCQVLGDLPFDEALQAGRIGLWHAILGYDPRRGYAFATYAWPAIMRQVWRAVKGQRPAADPALPADLLSRRSVAPDEAVVTAAVCQALGRLVGGLPGRLRYVVVARYGLADAPPALYREIGAALGLSDERARQLHQEALARLRQPAASQTLRSLLGRHTQADYETVDTLTQGWLRQRGGRRGR